MRKALSYTKNTLPLFPSAKAFLDYQDSLNTSDDRIVYNDVGTAILINAPEGETDVEEKV